MRGSPLACSRTIQAPSEAVQEAELIEGESEAAGAGGLSDAMAEEHGWRGAQRRRQNGRV